MLAGLAALAAACLPAGDPPVGRQVRAGRDRNLAGVMPPRTPDDGVLRLLLTRTRDFGYDYDLYLLSVPDGGSATEQLLVEHWPNSSLCAPTGCVSADSKGRLYVWSFTDSSAEDRVLVRVDPQTGDRLAFAGATSVRTSPSGQRVAVQRPAFVLDVIEADDTITSVPEASIPLFVGEDLYYLDGLRALRRLTADGVSEAIKTGVESFMAIDTADGLRLLIHGLAAPLALPNPLSLLDPATLDERPLPFDTRRFHSLSSDARWALLHDGGDKVSNRSFALVDVATAREEPFELPSELADVEWRPGRPEVWLNTPDFQQVTGLTSIKRAGSPLTLAPATANRSRIASDLQASMFSSDGQHWYSTVPSPTAGRRTLFVGNADDPEGPRFPLNPEGTLSFGSRELSGGRLLVEAFYQSPERNDIYAVDAATGETRLLGREGVVLASGGRRVLAKLHNSNGDGDLTVLDVDAGPLALLAAEFARAAFVQPPAPGAPAVEPGARVGFEFRARFDSRYDGIWVTVLP